MKAAGREERGREEGRKEGHKGKQVSEDRCCGA
jgi:hypothetical protein